MDQLIVSIIALVLILVLSLQFFLLCLPFFQRMTFDTLCHQALMKMDQAGGMTTSIQSQLESDLVARGFQNPVIQGDWNVSFGSEIGLYVAVSLSSRQFQPDYLQTVLTRKFVYENSILSRHILTAADGT